MVDGDDEHADGFGVLWCVCAGEELGEVECEGFGGDELGEGGCDAHLDEFLDHGQVEDVGEFLREGLDRDFDLYPCVSIHSFSSLPSVKPYLGNTHKCYRQVPHERRLLHKLYPHPRSGHKALDDSIDRDRNLEPVECAYKELEHEMDIVETELLLLSGESLVGQGDLIVLRGAIHDLG